MAFEEVFVTLKEIFHQVDPRILRAVAFEHSNNANEAIESVLMEILPYAKYPETSYIQEDVHQEPDSSGQEAVQKQTGMTKNENDVQHAITEDVVDSRVSVSDSIYQNFENCLSGLSGQDGAMPESINMFNGRPKNSHDSYESQVSYCSVGLSESQDSPNVETTAVTLAAISPSPDILDGSCAISSAIEAEVLSVYDKTPLTETIPSGSFVNNEFLEDTITNAKSSKDVLLSSVESVTSIITNAYLLEERAKQAKEEASHAGQDIFSKVVELKQIVERVKESNNLHAGEVHGKESILVTESCELQSRVLILLEEKDNSLSIIEEIRKTLESRLSAAEEQIALAEQEKLEREALARKALSEQKLLMQSIVEESKFLQEAEENNSKLREFLMEHGHIVDNLQGEIAVIFEDIMLLKESADGRLPLKASFYSVSSSLASLSSSSSCRTSTLSDDFSQDISSDDFLVLEQKQHELQCSESNSRGSNVYIGDRSGELEDYSNPFEEDYYDKVLAGTLPDDFSQDVSSEDSLLLEQTQHELRYSESNSSGSNVYIGDRSGELEDYSNPFEEDYYDKVLAGTLPDDFSQDVSSEDSLLLEQTQHELRYSESNSSGSNVYIGDRNGELEDYSNPFEEDYYDKVLAGTLPDDFSQDVSSEDSLLLEQTQHELRYSESNSSGINVYIGAISNILEEDYYDKVLAGAQVQALD